jgi:NAD(P)-dependent dehydrogenase (short-subunit alcohol dehydrogenase family)
MAETQRLYGMKALVTSAAGGIGEAVARTLAKHGAEVLAVDRANSGIDRLYNGVRGVDGHAADINVPGDILAVVETVADKLGTIDILVNEFSPNTRTPIVENGPELARMLESRAELIMATCRAALPYLKKSPAGRIVNIGYVGREIFRKNKDLRDFFIRNSAAGRLGEPIDVAKVVLFLASDDAVFVSGTGIAVDGGNISA